MIFVRKPASTPDQVRGRHFRDHALAAGAALLLPQSAHAEGALRPVTEVIEAVTSLDRYDLAALTLTLGVILFAVVTAIALLRTRRRLAQMLTAKGSEINDLREERDRANALMLAEPQVIIEWPAGADEPNIIGELAIVTNSALPRRVLAFGTWLDPEQAHAMDDAVEALRLDGRAFALNLTTLHGRHVAAEGRAIGGRAVLRIKDLTGPKSELVELAADHQQLRRDIDTVGRLLEALPSPVWARDPSGRLTWVNAAYVRAVEARDGADAVARGLEILDPAARADVARARAAGTPYEARLPVIVAGTRRILQVIDRAAPGGSAGIGLDVTEVDAMREELARASEAHRRTLDQLATAVAIFSADQRLLFHNAAYRQLFGFDPAFLDSGPTDAALLDQLRAARKLPEQANFRNWRGELHEAYRALEPRQHEWHLPDGRTLRVVTTPNPEGGVTYLFDDVTERLNMVRRHEALISVQGETLEALAEGVVVFGSDGRLDLHNPAFARLWKLSSDELNDATPGDRPHIETVLSWCRRLYADDAFWAQLRGAVTGLERREPISARLERLDDTVIDCATVPLPDGATMVTFQDVTASVKVARALTERADALQDADRIKSAFVQHVSYELRTPLTNIIGFAHLLLDPAIGPTIGPITEKQRDYLDSIDKSSSALLAIINDILDLTTIDAGAMELDLKDVDIRAAVDAAALGLQDRIAEKPVLLDLRVAPDIGSFVADERRVRQILFNLLSNAISFSPAGDVVRLTVERRDGAVIFSVTDRGPGIPEAISERVFDRFESHALGSEHRGAGLGLSIVRSFVELHGGTVKLDSVVGRGTTVTCIFPLKRMRQEAAAE
ncbi:MAG TPA: PAS-domain containing protein [Xanthobacteraceae bacterium]|nr:PAS-domain containing protein [Xanthobacteraceae bacterium]